MSLYCSSEKNSEKPLKIDLLIRDLGKKRTSMSHTQKSGSLFLLEIIKGDHKLSRTLYFIKIL